MLRCCLQVCHTLARVCTCPEFLCWCLFCPLFYCLRGPCVLGGLENPRAMLNGLYCLSSRTVCCTDCFVTVDGFGFLDLLWWKSKRRKNSRDRSQRQHKERIDFIKTVVRELAYVWLPWRCDWGRGARFVAGPALFMGWDCSKHGRRKSPLLPTRCSCGTPAFKKLPGWLRGALFVRDPPCQQCMWPPYILTHSLCIAF